MRYKLKELNRIINIFLNIVTKLTMSTGSVSSRWMKQKNWWAHKEHWPKVLCEIWFYSRAKLGWNSPCSPRFQMVGGFQWNSIAKCREPRHIISNLFKLKDKERILEAEGNKIQHLSGFTQQVTVFAAQPHDMGLMLQTHVVKEKILTSCPLTLPSPCTCTQNKQKCNAIFFNKKVHI